MPETAQNQVLNSMAKTVSNGEEILKVDPTTSMADLNLPKVVPTEMSAATISEIAHDASISNDRQLVERAVTLLLQEEGPEVEGIMRECFRMGKGDSYFEGRAVAYLLERYPDDKEIRSEAGLRVAESGTSASSFAVGLLESRVPSAVLIVIDECARNSQITVPAWVAIAAYGKSMINSLTLDQRTADLEKLMHYARGEWKDPKSRESESVLFTLAESGYQPAVSTVEVLLHTTAPQKFVVPLYDAIRKAHAAEEAPKAQAV